MLKLITAATVDPVTSVEAKNYLSIDGTDYDSLIFDMIKATTDIFERYTRTSIITETYDLVLDKAFLGRYDVGMSRVAAMSIPNQILLPRPPLQSITGVYVTDDLGNETLVDPSYYSVDTISTPGRIFLNLGYVWPYYRWPDGFRVRFVAGYPDANSYPKGIKLTFYMLLAHQYYHRGDDDAKIPDYLKARLDMYKVY